MDGFFEALMSAGWLVIGLFIAVFILVCVATSLLTNDQIGAGQTCFAVAGVLAIVVVLLVTGKKR